MSVQTVPSDGDRVAGGVGHDSQRNARPPARRVTIAQIAQQTGLSVATVSKVLNGKRDVSAQTRTLVQNVLVSSGYRRRASGKHRR